MYNLLINVNKILLIQWDELWTMARESNWTSITEELCYTETFWNFIDAVTKHVAIILIEFRIHVEIGRYVFNTSTCVSSSRSI